MHNSGSISQNKSNQAQFYSHEAERILIQETLSFGTDQVPTFNFSLLASYIHLIWLCPLPKARLKDTW